MRSFYRKYLHWIIGMGSIGLIFLIACAPSAPSSSASPKPTALPLGNGVNSQVEKKSPTIFLYVPYTEKYHVYGMSSRVYLGSSDTEVPSTCGGVTSHSLYFFDDFGRCIVWNMTPLQYFVEYPKT